MSDTSTTVKYGDFEVDLATLPQISVLAMFRRGLAHYLGNEQASKLTAWAESHEKEHGSKPADEARDAAKASFQAAAMKALVDGSVGANVRGPRGSALETIMRGIAEKRVREILKQAGLSMPSGDKAVKFPNGTELTRADLIDRQLARNGDAIRVEAERELKARERAAAKAVGDAGSAMAALGID